MRTNAFSAPRQVALLVLLVLTVLKGFCVAEDAMQANVATPIVKPKGYGYDNAEQIGYDQPEQKQYNYGDYFRGQDRGQEGDYQVRNPAPYPAPYGVVGPPGPPGAMGPPGGAQTITPRKVKLSANITTFSAGLNADLTNDQGNAVGTADAFYLPTKNQQVPANPEVVIWTVTGQLTATTNHPDLSGSMVFGGVLLFNWNTTSDTYVIGPVGSTLFYLGGNVPGVVGGTVTLLGSGPVEGIANGQGIPTYAGELEFNLLVAK